jgi:hypothetical protein
VAARKRQPIPAALRRPFRCKRREGERLVDYIRRAEAEREQDLREKKRLLWDWLGVDPNGSELEIAKGLANGLAQRLIRYFRDEHVLWIGGKISREIEYGVHMMRRHIVHGRLTERSAAEMAKIDVRKAMNREVSAVRIRNVYREIYRERRLAD